jgi:hypothetical protein
MSRVLTGSPVPSLAALVLAILCVPMGSCYGHGWKWHQTTVSGPVAPVVPVYSPIIGNTAVGWPTTASAPPPYAAPISPFYPAFQYPGYSYPNFAQMGALYPGYAQPTFSYPAYPQPGPTYQAYTYPGYFYPGYAFPGSPQQPPPSNAPSSYLADFDPSNAPIVAPIPGAVPAFGGMVSLGVQILGDLASHWFSGAVGDRNGLLQIAEDIFRRRTNQPPNQSISGHDLSKLGQMVDRIIASVTRGGVNPANGGAGPKPPTPSQNQSDVLSFTVTAPLNSGVTGINLQYATPGTAGPPTTTTPPKPTSNQPPAVNRTSPSGGPGNP